NIYFLVQILVSIFGAKRNKSCNESKNIPTRAKLLMSSVFFFAFGIAWIFYPLYLSQALSPYFSYVFIVLNGTQVRCAVEMINDNSLLKFKINLIVVYFIF